MSQIIQRRLPAGVVVNRIKLPVRCQR